MKKNHLKLAIIIGFIGLIILTTGVTYSVFVANNPDENIQVMTTGKAKIEISDEVFPTFTELVPLTDEEGLNETDNSYNFTVSNVGDTKINYKLYLIDNQIDGAEILSDEYIKTSVMINKKNMGIKRLSEVNEAINNGENTGRLLNDKDLTTKSESESSSKDSYVIKIWLDNERIENMSDAEKMELDDKALSLKLKVVATQVFDINAEYIPPEIGISIDNVTTNSFRITAGTEPTSDSDKIESYEFSCDGETPVPSSDNTYTCTNVKTGLHNSVQARAKDIKKSYIYSNKGEVSTQKLGEITMASTNAGWATSKTITITYPKNINNFTYQYRINNGGWQTVSDETVNVPLTSNASVIARVSDGTNTITKEYIEDKIDTEKPVCTWSGPYTTATGTTALTYLKAGGVGYYQLNCSDASTLTINESEIGLTNTNATITKESQNGNRYVYKVTAGSSSGVVKAKVMEGFATDQVGLRNVESTSTKGITIDVTAPTCGTVTGGSTTWTNGNRKISVVCNDTGGSNCAQPSYENTYSSNATTANITIRDNAGNTRNCPVNVYIDKNPPTCTITGQSTTWTLENRTIGITCSDTGGSGITKTDYSKTYTTGTTKTDTITVTDRSGNSNVYTYNVYVSKSNLSSSWKNKVSSAGYAANNFIALYTLNTISFSPTMSYNGTYSKLGNPIDVSEQNDRSVLLQVYSNGSNQIAAIGQEGGVVAPANSYGLFASIDSTTKYKNIYLNNFDTRNVTNMSYMFVNCSSLTSLNLTGFNTLNVTDMQFMFYDCASLKTITFGSDFNTLNVTNMRAMFEGCSSLTDLDLSSFDTSSVKNMNGMFYICSSLKSLNLSNFDTSQVTIMAAMFADCNALTSLNLSSFDTRMVTTMNSMFSGCSSLTSLNLTTFSNAQADVNGMFLNCNSLSTIYVKSGLWNTDGVYTGFTGNYVWS